jgi:hypothetical protein
VLFMDVLRNEKAHRSYKETAKEGQKVAVLCG